MEDEERKEVVSLSLLIVHPSLLIVYETTR